jgi:hypothetical protein
MVIDHNNGLLISRSTKPRLRMRLIDGELQPIGVDNQPIGKAPSPVIAPEVATAAIESIGDESPSDLRSIAVAMLEVDPSGIVAVYADSKGRVLGSTITRTTNGHTPAAFRSAFRSLPREAKQVTFAMVSPINSAMRATLNEYADIFLIRVADCLLLP